MTEILEIIRLGIALVFFLLASLFGVAGVWGLYRFPDVYSRLQGSSLAGTTAVFSLFIGALALAPTLELAGRVAVIMVFFLVSAPTGSHIVARFAWDAGSYPWKGRKP